MANLAVVQKDSAEGKSKELLETVEQKMGRVPNILKGMANSPAALETYLTMSGVLSSGQLSGKERELIALSVSEKNGCGYCTAAHTVIGSMQGVGAEEAVASRKGESADPKLQALITFTLEVLEKKGDVGEASIKKVKEAGYGDAHIAEVVANVALNVFTNYFNHVNATDLDFPEVPAV